MHGFKQNEKSTQIQVLCMYVCTPKEVHLYMYVYPQGLNVGMLTK